MTLGQPAEWEPDDLTYRYSFTGDFGLGAVEVRFLAAASEAKDDSQNVATSETFTVTGATANLLERSLDVNELNEALYFDVRFSATARGDGERRFHYR